MKIFIAGATGVLGRRVVKLLTEKNHHVIGLARSLENVAALNAMNAEGRMGDLFREDEMIKLTADCDAVFHLATSIPKKTIPKRSDWTMNDRIRIDGTTSLTKACVANNIGIFLGQGITFLYGDLKGGEVTLSTPVNEHQPSILASAYEMEKIIRANLTLNYLILRFGSFYSADSFQTIQLIENVWKQKMPMIGDGNYYWNFIHADDAASAVVYSFENFQRLKGTAINFSDFSPLLYKDLLNILVSKTGSGKPPAMPLVLAKSIHGKATLDFLTASCRIMKDERISDWNPKFKNFEDGITSVLHEMNH